MVIFYQRYYRKPRGRATRCEWLAVCNCVALPDAFSFVVLIENEVNLLSDICLRVNQSRDGLRLQEVFNPIEISPSEFNSLRKLA